MLFLPAKKLPCTSDQEDISLELAEKKRATYLSDYPIINKNPSLPHGLVVHKRRDNPLACVDNLDPEFRTLYDQVQKKVERTKSEKRPTILALVSPLEEHLLHYLPFRVKKTVVTEDFRPYITLSNLATSMTATSLALARQYSGRVEKWTTKPSSS